jgi:hypothetical protein
MAKRNYDVVQKIRKFDETKVLYVPQPLSVAEQYHVTQIRM